MTPDTYRILDVFADSFNPFLAVVALAAPFVRRRRILRATVVYYLSTGAAIGLVYLVRLIDDYYRIWASHGLDYSTHSAFAASLVVSVGVFHRRWLAPLVIAVLLYFSLVLFMWYHSLADILTSVPLAAAVAFAFSRLHVNVDRTRRREEAKQATGGP